MANKYSIYGDDDQQRLDKIFAEEEEIQRMVDIENKKTMKERSKRSAKKEVLDSTVNSERPEPKIEDIPPAKPAVKRNEPDPEEIKKKLKEKKKAEKKEKKQKKGNGFILKLIVVLIFIALVVGTFVSLGGMEIIQNTTNNLTEKVTGLISTKVNKVEETPTNEAVGYINAAEDKDYTLKELLTSASVASSALQSYYGRLQELAELSKNNDVHDTASQLKNDIMLDSQNFETYLADFELYQGGVAYHQSIMKRFDNINELMSTLDYIENSKVYSYINNYVDKENQLIVTSKNSLIDFLDLNGVPYTDKGNSVEFVLK